MRASLVAAASLPALWSFPAWSCVDTSEAHDRSVSKRVVEGRIQCDRKTDRCKISVDRFLKPIHQSSTSSKSLTIRAGYRRVEQWEKDGLIVITCPWPFSPVKTDFYGRFYLMSGDKPNLYHVRRHYVRDADGEFYANGIKCGPVVAKPDGTTSRHCEDVGNE